MIMIMIMIMTMHALLVQPPTASEQRLLRGYEYFKNIKLNQSFNESFLSAAATAKSMSKGAGPSMNSWVLGNCNSFSHI